MSINRQDLLCLSNLLLPDQIGQHSLENISNIAQKQFPPNDHFRICRVLIFLLKNNFLYDAISRFSALFIVCDMCKSEPRSCLPFTEFLLSYLPNETDNQLPASALYVLHCLLSHPEQFNEFAKLTPVQVMNFPIPAANRELDWGFLQPDEKQQESSIPQTAACGISCVLNDKDLPPSARPEISASSQLRRQRLELLLSQREPLACKDSLRPEFLRIYPPLHPSSSDSSMTQFSTTNECTSSHDSVWSEELVWLYPPVVQHDFYWDPTLEQPTGTSELHSLLSKALISALSQSEQQTVVQLISEQPPQLPNCGITPEKLPQLVNFNPIIAMELLASLSTTSQMNQYYDALVSMEVTVDSLEIVNRLSSRKTLPKEFIHAYISKCMSYCQSLQDKSSQSRLVRLVCLLIQSFVRNKILDIHSENILIEVQVFCVEFNKVNGANQLYRLIKNMESSLPSTSSP